MMRFSLGGGGGAMRCPQNTPAIPKTAAMGALTLARSLHPPHPFLPPSRVSGVMLSFFQSLSSADFGSLFESLWSMNE